MDNSDQSIFVDEEFCDKNLFTHYKRNIRENPKINAKIFLQNYQLSQLNRYHIGYSDQTHIKSTQNISLNKLELKRYVLQKPITKELEKTKEPLNRNSTVVDLKSKNMFFQRAGGQGKLKPIMQKEKLVNPIFQTQRLINKLNVEPKKNEVQESHHTQQKPASFRYNDLQLNQYLEDFKLLKQETLASVLLPQVTQKSTRISQNYTQTTSRQQVHHYYNQILPKNKVKQRQQDTKQQNLSLSGWSDYSNK